MTMVAGLLAYLLFPLFGVATWRIHAVRRAPLGARLAIAAAAGALVVAALMTLMSIAHIQWSRTSLSIALIVIVIVSARNLAPAPAAITTPRWETLAIAVFIILTTYGILTARETIPDLYLFWAPKAVRFFRDGGITVAFLQDPHSFALHPDYPPYLSVIYAWSMTVAHHFSFWAALLLAPLTLTGIAAIVRAYSGDSAGTLLVVATLAQAMAVGLVGGGGEPPLLLFETVTMVAITFIDDVRSQTILAMIGAAGATAMKIEGATFAIAVVIALTVVRRDIKRALLVGAPSAILFIAWYIFTMINHAWETYMLLGQFPFRVSMIPRVLALLPKSASYDLWYLPWLAPMALLGLGQLRRAALPLSIALLTFGATVFFYSRGEDPSWWIGSSAPRVLMTPLLALDLAAIAAWSERPSGHVASAK